MIAGVVLSAAIVAAYARGAWPLAFLMLVPWLLSLDRVRSARGAGVAALAMAVAFVAAVFGWFAPAIADYTGAPTAGAMAVLLLAAPMLQPQIIAYALVRHAAAKRYGTAARATLAIAAWIAVEWTAPRLFGDTLGHGLQPSRLLRQGADVAGAIGLTLVVLAANEALAAAVVRLRRPRRALVAPLGLAMALPLALGGYGWARLSQLEREGGGTPLRVGLVQAAIVDYERLRRERGTHAVVREVLDTHYALSRDLLERGADALVWPETVYPTTFRQPRSEAAAELDREIADFAAQGGAPLVFGTYERDERGEYNVAAFVDPLRGPLGAYRKTRLFPLTEFVPPAIDGPALRRLLPWAGTWQRGDGARVFPLFTADGREVPVAPMICRDDVDAGLARDGARLGAQLLVGLSNDAWFTRAPLGARLHLLTASFRSIETRLPQVRATTNGISASIDRTGAITAETAMGGRAALLAEVAIREPSATLFVRFGGWLGPAAWLVLVAAGIGALVARRRPPARLQSSVGEAVAWADASHRVLLLRPRQRVAITALRALSRSAVLVMGAAALASDEPPKVLVQVREFAVWVLVPEVLAMALAAACAATLRVEAGRLLLATARRRIEIDRSMLEAVQRWRWPLPSAGFDLVFVGGRTWTHGIAMRGAGLAVRALASMRVAESGDRGAPVHHDATADDATESRSAAGSGPDSRLSHDRAEADGAAVHRASDASGRAISSAIAEPIDGGHPDAAARRDDGPAPARSIGANAPAQRPTRLDALFAASDIPTRRIDHPLIKFVVFPLVPALPAFRLHQLIAYGSPFGEYYTFGAHAYLSALLIWWASWAVKLVLLAGGLRLLAECGAAAALALRPGHAPGVRGAMLAAARIVYFVGVPLWLWLRLR